MGKNKNLQPIIYVGLIVAFLAAVYYVFKTIETKTETETKEMFANLNTKGLKPFTFYFGISLLSILVLVILFGEFRSRY